MTRPDQGETRQVEVSEEVAARQRGPMNSSPPNIPPDVWARFVAKVTPLTNFRCPALWHAPPRDDGYGQFWIPAHVEPMLGDPGELAEPDPGQMVGAMTLFDLDPTSPPGVPDAAPTQPSGRPWRAHRVSWAAWHGPLGPDEVVMHRCDRPLCTPITSEDVDHHLILGDLQTNAADRENKGRSAGRRHRGLTLWGGADRRGPQLRSLAIHQTLTAARAAGLTGRHLTRAVAAADAAGVPFPGQLTFRPTAEAARPTRRESSLPTTGAASAGPEQLHLTRSPPH